MARGQIASYIQPGNEEAIAAGPFPWVTITSSPQRCVAASSHRYLPHHAKLSFGQVGKQTNSTLVIEATIVSKIYHIQISKIYKYVSVVLGILFK